MKKLFSDNLLKFLVMAPIVFELWTSSSSSSSSSFNNRLLGIAKVPLRCLLSSLGEGLLWHETTYLSNRGKCSDSSLAKHFHRLSPAHRKAPEAVEKASFIQMLCSRKSIYDQSQVEFACLVSKMSDSKKACNTLHRVPNLQS